MKMEDYSRRDFIKKSSAAAMAFSIVPSTVVSGLGHKMPSDKLNIAGIGVGGRGFGVLKGMGDENVVALCDVDWKYAQGAFDYYPKAKRYWDWRKMYDEMADQFDAVVVATADHSHAVCAAHAITMGKHVYCEKPLTHSVYESRLLTKLAKKYNVATTMGNQGASGEGVRQSSAWIRNGEIGEVRKVEAFTDRPIWPQGLNTPSQGQWVPDHLNWDLFIGPAQMRPYNEIYTPWNWRGWWDYGTGALGDMACHILHPVFVGLNLGYPTKVQGSSTLLLKDCAPTAEKVKFTFPERPKVGNQNMPEVEVYWYDGGITPEMPDNWPAGKSMNNSGGGVIFHGTKDTLICGCYGLDPWLLSGRKPEVEPFLRQVDNHYLDFVRAAKESAEDRTPTRSDFSEAGPFNEMVVMGVLAVRLQGLNKELEWDGENMQFTNIKDDEMLRIVVEDGFKIEDGHPTFDKTFTDPFSAKEFANELIKHTYREGYSLPEMPS
jgi:predicted dehydrogenase